MRTVEEIKKSINKAEWFIKNHKEQINIYLDDDIDCVLAYSEKIKLLEVEIECLKWVLNESV